MYKDFLTTAFYSSFISAYKLRILKCKPHYLCHFTFVFISAGQITCFLGELESLVKNVTIRFGITWYFCLNHIVLLVEDFNKSVSDADLLIVIFHLSSPK